MKRGGGNVYWISVFFFLCLLWVSRFIVFTLSGSRYLFVHRIWVYGLVGGQHVRNGDFFRKGGGGLYKSSQNR